ncbi:hypothetical protein DMP08_12080 [Paraeggerthella hongkongensis]|uniref:Uncharacterized protein n=2 Tax=Paraeggerthella hongkongensis TaxID=230658 RepID=A0A3N0ATN4_9ACTN|nr:hypothetical protein DMP08_12080 [Paraeggerthella hongkongensis]
MKAEFESTVDSTLDNLESRRVAETYEIKHTKSTYLKQLLNHTRRIKRVSRIANSAPGDLLRIDGVSLSVVDNEQIFQMQVLRHDALKGMRVQGLDVNNIVSSMLEDYSYILATDFERENSDGTNGKERLAIKIPSESANEFESKYRIHDLLLGEVSLVGVYKGKVDGHILQQNTFTSLQTVSLDQTSNTTTRIIKSADYSIASTSSQRSDCKEPEVVHYLDLIAILQPVSFDKTSDISPECESVKNVHKGLFARIKEKLCHA